MVVPVLPGQQSHLTTTRLSEGIAGESAAELEPVFGQAAAGIL